MPGMGIKYSPEIDGLRAIAVLAVVVFHAGAGGAGFVGVDVFFAISGYLITSLLLAEWLEAGRIDLGRFYARRVRRILPAVVLVVLATLAAGTVLLPPAAYAHLVASAAAALLFVGNAYFQATTGGYFDASAEQMPLLHLWSLAVEEQFYLVWPLALAGLLRLRRDWLRPAIAGLAVASFALATMLVANGPQGGEIAFHQMPARFWELALGGLVATLPARRVPRGTLAIGLALVLVACVRPVQPFPGPGALPAVAGASLVLLAVHGGGELGMAGNWLRSPPMRLLGLVSYSFYLWHWPLLALYRATSIGEGAPGVRAGLCVLALLLAVATYRYVEQPFRSMRGSSRRFVVGGAAASLLLAGGISAFAWATRPILVNDNPLALRAERDMPPRTCHSTGMEPPAIKCAPIAQTRIGIWGDSQAYAWSPSVWAQDPNGSAFSRDACRPLLDFVPEAAYPADLKCRAFNALVAERVKGLDTLVLASVWDVASAGRLARTLDAVAPRVRRIIVLGPTPRLREHAGRCIRQDAQAECAVPRTEFDANATPILAALRAAAAHHPNVRVLDMTSRFCTATECPVLLRGVPLYWDNYHVSSSVAKAFVLPEIPSTRQE
jgi:peptidoglycan/LPS O-acetylase OafA/YrhL